MPLQPEELKKPLTDKTEEYEWAGAECHFSEGIWGRRRVLESRVESEFNKKK